MTAYYNEFDPYAAAWLRNLISEGLIAPGDVDERSIVDVQPEDLTGYTQCHFFAGIGGWSLGLRLAGWPDDRPVWTGSCPCQPFSAAGKRRGFADERHLWPVFKRLVQVGRPPVLFGEQVARAPEWLALVRGDLVELGYAVGAIPMEAASASADHFRDRYWFVADRDGSGGQPWQPASPPARYGSSTISDGGDDSVRHMADMPSQRGDRISDPAQSARWPSTEDYGHGHGHGQRSQIAVSQSRDAGPELAAPARNDLRALVDRPSFGWGEGWTEPEFRSRGFAAAVASVGGGQYLECPDGKWRRLPPPGVRWLGTRIPARVDKLRAIGNAIDPRPAAEFVGAYLDLR